MYRLGFRLRGFGLNLLLNAKNMKHVELSHGSVHPKP